MRRKDREVTSYDKMLEVVEGCDCLRIGLVDEREAYIVPLNFGYEAKDGGLTLYFHGASEGRKMDLIRNHPTASFEMDRKHELVEGTVPCAYSYLFQSVMGKGKIEILEDHAEKVHGLTLIMEHYTDKKEWAFPEKMVNSMAVIKLTVSDWSCKEH